MAACLNDTARSGDQDELPNMRLPEEILLRRHDVDHRECLSHARPNLTSLDVADQVREDGFVPRRAADEPDIAQVEGANIKIDDRAGDRAGGDETSAAPDCFQRRREAPTSDVVDHYIARLRLKDLVAFDQFVGTERSDLVELRLRGHGDDMGASASGELH